MGLLYVNVHPHGAERRPGMSYLSLPPWVATTPASVTRVQLRSSLPFLVMRPCVAADQLMQLHGSGTCRFGVKWQGSTGFLHGGHCYFSVG